MPSSIEGVSRRKVLKATGVGAVGTVGLAVAPGIASANCPCTCVTLGKIEEGDLPPCGETTTVTLTLDGDLRLDESDCEGDKEVDVKVTSTDCKDGGDEVTGVDLEIEDNNGACYCADDGIYLCGAEVKGGRETESYDCDDVDDQNQVNSQITDARPPVAPNGKFFGISHITVKVCVFPGDEQTGGDCPNDGG